MSVSAVTQSVDRRAIVDRQSGDGKVQMCEGDGLEWYVRRWR